MHFEKSITITQTNNGWLVIVPYIHSSYPIMPIMGVPSEKEIRRQARIMKSEIQKDELLSGIMDENEKIVKEDYKHENIYTFKTFAEVIGFLKITLNQ